MGTAARGGPPSLMCIAAPQGAVLFATCLLQLYHTCVCSEPLIDKSGG